MAVKFIKVCGLDRPRTKLDLGRVTKKVTKIRHPGCCDQQDLFVEIYKQFSAICYIHSQLSVSRHTPTRGVHGRSSATVGHTRHTSLP